MKLYDRQRSGNCYRARLMLALLGIEYERVPVITHGGASIFYGHAGHDLAESPDQAALDRQAEMDNRSADFLAMSPRGHVPVLQDGDRVIWDSTAILVYLARKYGGESWLPAGDDEADVVQWLVLAQNELLYGLARIRGIAELNRPGNVEECRALGRSGLSVMENRLRDHEWLALGHRTIADVACFPYVALAPELGVPLFADYSSIVAWIDRVRSLPGFVEHFAAKSN